MACRWSEQRTHSPAAAGRSCPAAISSTRSWSPRPSTVRGWDSSAAPSTRTADCASFSANDFPGIRIAGSWAPTRSELTDPAASERIAAEIRDADVDILVVALAKPLQEEWITRFGPATGARALLAFGAAIDFWAGGAAGTKRVGKREPNGRGG